MEGPAVAWTFPDEGTYPVTLTVTDDDGATAVSQDNLPVTYLPVPVEAKAIWAMVVGISDYAEVNDLRYSRKDAEAFYAFLVDDARVPQDNIQLLLDQQATLTEVRAGLEWLRRRADPDDLVIFFFAGHGYQGIDRPPLDEDDGLDEYFVLYDTKKDAMEATALRDDEFGQFLDLLQSRHMLVVFDSCHAGGGERGDRGLPSGARPTSDTFDLWDDFDLEGRLVLASSTEDQLSYECTLLEQGVFTHFLLQGLGGGADANGDGKVTVQELHDYVASEVPVYVRETFGEEQYPKMIGQGTTHVVIAKANQAPVADFSYLPELPFPGKQVRFHDTSTDDAGIVSWLWTFDDQAISTEQHPAYTYNEPGTYTVTLTVVDDRGLATTTTQQLLVAPHGEVTAVSGDTIVISLGFRHGVQVGDRFQVVHIYQLASGITIPEYKATVEVTEIFGATRSACRVLEYATPIERLDIVLFLDPGS